MVAEAHVQLGLVRVGEIVSKGSVLPLAFLTAEETDVEAMVAVVNVQVVNPVRGVCIRGRERENPFTFVVIPGVKVKRLDSPMDVVVAVLKGPDGCGCTCSTGTCPSGQKLYQRAVCYPLQPKLWGGVVGGLWGGAVPTNKDQVYTTLKVFFYA